MARRIEVMDAKRSVTVPKDQSRLPSSSSSYPDFNFMEKFPPMGKVTPAYQAKLGVRDNKDYDQINKEESYAAYHANDEERRDTNSDELGSGQGGVSQRQTYGF